MVLLVRMVQNYVRKPVDLGFKNYPSYDGCDHTQGGRGHKEQKMRIRKARTDEGPILSGIALRSKAYWGYDKDFIEACKEDLTISEQKIEKNHVYVLEDPSGIIGFYCLAAKGKTGSLDFLFIDPGFIGKGYGRLLWESIMQTAREIGLEEFTIDSDPHAEEFYKKMGAVRIGEVGSTVFRDRKLPLMKVSVSK